VFEQVVAKQTAFFGKNLMHESVIFHGESG
jgi:hypothetical protein